jgi:hypothetical protein
VDNTHNTKENENMELDAAGFFDTVGAGLMAL